MIRINGHDCVSENYREILYLIPLKYIWMAKICDKHHVILGFRMRQKSWALFLAFTIVSSRRSVKHKDFTRAEGDATPNTHGDWNWSTWRQPEFFESNTHRNNSYIVKHGDGIYGGIMDMENWDKNCLKSLEMTRDV